MSPDEFAVFIAKRRQIDPLIMFWHTISGSFFNLAHMWQRGLLDECEFEKAIIYQNSLFAFDSPIVTRNLLMGKHLQFRTAVGAHGLWKVTIGIPTKRNGYPLVTLSRSNEYIERVATIAFLYMRPICGRDVASIIARKVARMYLDDYAWLQTYGPTLCEHDVRERILQWLPV